MTQIPGQKRLTLDNLRVLDFGVIAEAFDVEIARVVADCQDRPADDRARSVSINFKIAPLVDAQAGVLNASEIMVDCEITSTVPKRRTKPYRMVADRSGALLFQPDSPENPNQSGMFDDEEMPRMGRIGPGVVRAVQ